MLWGGDHFVRHFSELLGWMERHPELKMGLDNEAWMYDWLAENQPSVLEEIAAGLRAFPGRLGLSSCTYGQPLAALILDESNIRQIHYGLDTTKRRLGQTLRVYSFSEHAAFPQLPQIVKGFGLDGILLRTHYLMYGYCPGYDLPVCLWQSPDGSEVPCVPTYKGQERQVANHRAHPPGPFGLTTEDTWILTRYPSENSPHSLDRFRERFAHIKPLVATRLDDSGLKREELVDELEGRAEYRWCLLDELFQLLPEATEMIAPKSDDFGVRMPWGYRGNELFDLARRAEILALTVERLAALDLPEVRVNASAELNLIWKNLLIAQHHDVQIVARSGAQGRERLYASLSMGERLLRRLLDDYTSSECESLRFVAFNPLAWPRNSSKVKTPDGSDLYGQGLLPGLGVGHFSELRETEVVEGLNLETEEFRVEFSPEGGIAALGSREGVSFFQSGRRSASLAAVVDGVAVTGLASELAVTRGTAGVQAVEKGKIGPMPYILSYFFPAGERRLDLTLEVRFDGEVIGAVTDQKNDSRSCFVHEEKLRIRFFPVAGSGEIGIADEPFGFRTTGRSYVEGNLWTGVAGAEGGLVIANRGTMGSVRESDGAFSVPLAFSTSYVWGMEPLGGLRRWELGVLPFSGEWRPSELHRRALEFAFPPVAIPGALRHPDVPSFCLRDEHLQMTAFHPIESGQRLMRIWNSSDSPRALDLGSLHWKVLAEADLRGMAVESSGGMFRPWEFKTFLIE